MMKEIRSPNLEMPVSSLGFRHSFGFRHSSFGFENYSLFISKSRSVDWCERPGEERLMEALLARAVSTLPASTGAASEDDRERKSPGRANRIHHETNYERAAR